MFWFPLSLLLLPRWPLPDGVATAGSAQIDTAGEVQSIWSLFPVDPGPEFEFAPKPSMGHAHCNDNFDQTAAVQFSR